MLKGFKPFSHRRGKLSKHRQSLPVGIHTAVIEPPCHRQQLTALALAIAVLNPTAPAWADDVLGLPPVSSPPNTPFVDPLPIPPVMQKVNLSPAPTKSANPATYPDRKITTATGDSVNLGGFTEAPRADHQKWTEHFTSPGLTNPSGYTCGGESDTAPGFTGDMYESVEMEVNWNFYPKQDNVPASKIWTFVDASNGAVGPLRINAQYGTPVIHRIHNALPIENHGFGINQTSTHLHNAHTPSESDGGPTHFYDAGHYKDYNYPNVRAGFASDVPSSTWNGITVPGDIKETMSTLWFHDHRFDFTSQNVYKGLVGFYTLFSNDIKLDTDDETKGLRLPSGEFDVPMVLGDKAFDPVTGQLYFDLGNLDGILGDKYTVNNKIQPYMEVQPRKYRFRVLDGGPSRFYELFLSDGSNFTQITTNGNLLPAPVQVKSFRLGVAERTDVIIDFSKYKPNTKLYLQNRLEQLDGRGPTGTIIAPTNLVEFRVQKARTGLVDNSRIPSSMLPLPDKYTIPTVAKREFKFETQNGAWVVNGSFFDPNHISVFPKQNTAERWTIKSGGGWSHPVHLHHEEFQILSRNGKPPAVEDLGRKDVIRMGRAAIGTETTGSADIVYRFRDWLGTYPVHCHNVVHEDHAMMTQYEIVP